MLFLCLDFETTGLSSETDLPIELGLVLWDSVLKTPLRMTSTLIKQDVVITDEITKITGITNKMLDILSIKEADVVQAFQGYSMLIDAYVAHNAPFDRKFLEAMFKRQGLKVADKIWIDTSKDIPYPESITTRKLTHLACEHGFLNPFPHRALPDVLTMIQVMSKYDCEEIVKYAQTPNLRIKAGVSFENKDLAKERGYRYDGDTKSWYKEIKEFQLEKEIKEAKFKITVIQGVNGAI
jgi:DNA polymerase-3 subunit epsilon